MVGLAAGPGLHGGVGLVFQVSVGVNDLDAVMRLDDRTHRGCGLGGRSSISGFRGSHKHR